MVKQALRLAVAVVALVFVVGGGPVAAQEEYGCFACAQCHPEQGCIWCGSMVSFTVDSCCGNFVDGWAYCVGGYGFAVVCNDGQRCMCNQNGEECDHRND